MIFNKPINVKHIMSDSDYKIIGYVINKNNSNNNIMVMYQELTTNSDKHYVKDLEIFKENFSCDVADLNELFNDK